VRTAELVRLENKRRRSRVVEFVHAHVAMLGLALPALAPSLLRPAHEAAYAAEPKRHVPEEARKDVRRQIDARMSAGQVLETGKVKRRNGQTRAVRVRRVVARRVLDDLLSSAQCDGITYRSYEGLADQAGCSRDTAINAVAALVHAGAVIPVPMFHRLGLMGARGEGMPLCNAYAIPLARVTELDPKQTPDAAPTRPTRSRTPATIPAAPTAPDSRPTPTVEPALLAAVLPGLVALREEGRVLLQPTPELAAAVVAFGPHQSPDLVRVAIGKVVALARAAAAAGKPFPVGKALAVLRHYVSTERPERVRAGESPMAADQATSPAPREAPRWMSAPPTVLRPPVAGDEPSWLAELAARQLPASRGTPAALPSAEPPPPQPKPPPD
jgi:hypothetical protein